MDDVEGMLPEESDQCRQQKRIGHRREPFPECMDRDAAPFQFFDKRSPRSVKQQNSDFVTRLAKPPCQVGHQTLGSAGTQGSDDMEDSHGFYRLSQSR